MITKSIIRKTVLSYRKLLSVQEYEQRNSAVLQKTDELLKEKGFHSIHLFLAISANKEPSISPLLPKLWKRGVTTLTSVTDFKKREMRHFFLNAATKLEPNHLGIPEPVKATEANLDEVEVVLIPLLLADRSGSRIGYGGGFYDQLLSETKAVKIGLSLSNPVDRIEQTDDWDIPLDFLITPYKIYNYG